MLFSISLMSDSEGTRLGAYEICEPIGKVALLLDRRGIIASSVELSLFPLGPLAASGERDRVRGLSSPTS